MTLNVIAYIIQIKTNVIAFKKRGVKMLYTNLSVEMEKRGVTISTISRALNMRRSTVSDKLHGNFRIYYDEAKKIKNEFFSDCDMEYLFSTEEVIEHDTGKENSF